MWALTPLLLAGVAHAQVTAAGPNGPTNPEKPAFYAVGEAVNQTSESRLISVNGIDDFCIYAPMEPGPESTIGNTEPTVVSYCTKPRNGARLIPDGVVKSVQLLKTPMYIQVSGLWDGTKLTIPDKDDGGELDPHGATGEGNPVGGNVTTNLATGGDVFYEEWMMFVSYDQFCLRICTAETENVTAALMCEHELDVMGCEFVMASELPAEGTFEMCDGDNAAPPGLYPQADGSYSTWRQSMEPTPTEPAFIPKSSNCVKYSTISNGVQAPDYKVTAAPILLSPSDGKKKCTKTRTSGQPCPCKSKTASGAGASATPASASGAAASGPTGKPSAASPATTCPPSTANPKGLCNGGGSGGVNESLESILNEAGAVATGGDSQAATSAARRVAPRAAAVLAVVLGTAALL